MRAFVLVSLVAAACLLAARPTLPWVPTVTYQVTSSVDTPLVMEGIPQTRLDSLGQTAFCLVKYMALAPHWVISLKWTQQKNPSWSAQTTILPAYRRAYIEVDSVRVAGYGQQALKRLMVHELVHLPVHDLAELAMETDSVRGKRMRELLVVTVERWPLWENICIWREDT